MTINKHKKHRGQVHVTPQKKGLFCAEIEKQDTESRGKVVRLERQSFFTRQNTTPTRSKIHTEIRQKRGIMKHSDKHLLVSI